ATLSGCHKDNAAGATIDNRAQVELLVDVGQGLHQNLAHWLAMLVCLVSDQILAQPVLRKLTDLVLAFDQLYTTGLATPAGVHLRLDHPSVATNFSGCINGFFGGIAGNAFRYRQAVFSE